MPGAAQFLGISGPAAATAGIWTLVGLILAYWVKGMADRRRASNEGVSVEAAATKILIDNLTAEISRMRAQINDQDARITALEAEKRAGLDREGVLRAENIRLESIIQSRGEVRQRVQQIVAADRVEEGRA